MLSLEGDGAQTVTHILKGSQFLAAKTLHAGNVLLIRIYHSYS